MERNSQPWDRVEDSRVWWMSHTTARRFLIPGLAVRDLRLAHRRIYDIGASKFGLWNALKFEAVA